MSITLAKIWTECPNFWPKKKMAEKSKRKKTFTKKLKM